MAKSGPENYQSTDVVAFGADRRLRPPESLPDAARRTFVNVISSHPASHFKAGDVELLSRYCEAAAAAEEAAFQMAQPGGMVTAEGKASPWVGIHVSMTKTMTTLAIKLRLGPQARAFKQSKKDVGPPMSAYERMRMDPKWLP